jgi:fructuronate reductase
MRYVTGVDEQGQPIDVRDPPRDEIARLAEEALSDPDRRVPALLSLRAVFGDDLPANPIFVDVVRNAVRCLYRDGARVAVDQR